LADIAAVSEKLRANPRLGSQALQISAGRPIDCPREQQDDHTEADTERDKECKAINAISA